MGHANCGGIQALWDDDGTVKSQFIQPWVLIAERAREKVRKEHAEQDRQQQLIACEQEAVLVSLENLLTFKCIKERLEAGNLSLHGWYFDVRVGELFSYQAESGIFEKVR
jgi:carbonic anhydrase